MCKSTDLHSKIAWLLPDIDTWRTMISLFFSLFFSFFGSTLVRCFFFSVGLGLGLGTHSFDVVFGNDSHAPNISFLGFSCEITCCKYLNAISAETTEKREKHRPYHASRYKTLLAICISYRLVRDENHRISVMTCGLSLTLHRDDDNNCFTLATIVQLSARSYLTHRPLPHYLVPRMHITRVPNGVSALNIRYMRCAEQNFNNINNRDTADTLYKILFIHVFICMSSGVSNEQRHTTHSRKRTKTKQKKKE